MVPGFGSDRANHELTKQPFKEVNFLTNDVIVFSGGCESEAESHPL